MRITTTWTRLWEEDRCLVECHDEHGTLLKKQWTFEDRFVGKLQVTQEDGFTTESKEWDMDEDLIVHITRIKGTEAVIHREWYHTDPRQMSFLSSIGIDGTGMLEQWDQKGQLTLRRFLVNRVDVSSEEYAWQTRQAALLARAVA